MAIQLDGDSHGVRVSGVGDGRFLEFVVQTFALGDLEGIAESFVVRTKTKQSADQRLVGTVPFAGPRKGSVELKEARLRSPADQAAGEKSEPARASGVGGRRTHHHWSDYVQQTHHFRSFPRGRGHRHRPDISLL